MDYITFTDADDIMHPQRIEILLKVFQDYDSDVILHNFLINNKNFEKIEEILVSHNSLTQCYTGCIIHKDNNKNLVYHIHHSQVTLKKYILEKIKFPEESEFNRREDAIFCHRVFGLENIKNAYIINELSYYSPSNTGGLT